MHIVNILVLVTVALVLLGGLVALGVGNRRWSIGTVVAGFLVILSAAAFVTLAARVAERDRAWRQKIADYERRLAEAELDRTAASEPPGWQEGPDSLARLRERRDHWQRGLDRINTWRGRVWAGASFQPPKDDGSPGKVELAPSDADEAPAPPIGVGSLVFLFDAAPFEEGGVYIGEFRVDAVAFDEAMKRHVLTVAQTAPRDAYDAKVLSRPHESVTVFEDLPIDRWLAFYRFRGREADEERADEVDDEAADVTLPKPRKERPDKVRELLASSAEVEDLVATFVKTFEQHTTIVPPAEWELAEKQAAEQPGTLWADVTFTKPHSLATGGGPAPEADAGAAAPKADVEYAAGDRATFDLQTAVELRNGDAVTIERVFRRRPLTDPMMILHGGATSADDAGTTTGTRTLVRLIRDQIAILERSNQQLRDALAAAVDNTADEKRVAGELEQDLASWRRDTAAAADLAAALERELDGVTRALRAAEAAIVTDGRELTAALNRLAGEIDRVAPPPERRAARP